MMPHEKPSTSTPAKPVVSSSTTGAASSGNGLECGGAGHLEFHPDHKGKFDEIVARFADGMVHVETMSGNACYVGFYWDDGRYCQWWISSKKRLHYHHEDGKSAPPRFNAQGVDTTLTNGGPHAHD